MFVMLNISEQVMVNKDIMEVCRLNSVQRFAPKGSDHLGILTACIKASISESIKVAPTLCRPVFSSSNVI
jgi:hypothetical protein